MMIGVLQSSVNFMSGGTSPIVDNLVMNQNASQLEVSFSITVDEYNQKPIIDSVTITGDAINGGTLTANIAGFFSPGSYPAGTHTYQWYRADTKQSAGTAISGATGSTHLLTVSDVAKFIRCVVTPKQVGGLNNTGDALTSVYTDSIADTSFNPVTNINWFTAHRPSGAVDIATNQYWLNEGALGGNNSTRNGTDPFPTYNVAQQAVEFTNTSSQELVLDLPNPQYNMPVEIWVRCKLKTQLAGWQRMMSFSADHLIEMRSTGQVYLSGGSCGMSLNVLEWAVFRFVVSGASNTSKINFNNGEFTNNAVPAATFAFGVNNGRIGANNSGTGTFANAYISHIFVKSGELSSGDQASMWQWFADNAPWD